MFGDVSILVLLEEPLQLVKLFDCFLLGIRVSILVLLEEPLQRRYLLARFRPANRFNPCFTGRTTSTTQDTGIIGFLRYVSILVLLEEPLQQWLYRKKDRNIISFNPCFTGRTTSTRLLPMVEKPNLRCFNPCFTGRTTSTSFQLTALETACSSFNPCFTGRTTSTAENSNRPVASWPFQSLFYWKNHFNSTF